MKQTAGTEKKTIQKSGLPTIHRNSGNFIWIYNINSYKISYFLMIIITKFNVHKGLTQNVKNAQNN